MLEPLVPLLCECFLSCLFKTGANVRIGGGGIGGIIASVSFRSIDAPTGYRPGLWTTVAAQLTIVIVSTILMLYFKRQNDQAKRGSKVLEGHSSEFFHSLHLGID